jgi:cation diffusion facilitator family transporter
MTSTRSPGERPQLRVVGGTGDQVHTTRLAVPAHQHRQRRVRFVLLVVLLLNLGVASAKITLGLLIGSLAMTADGFHSLLDGFANVVALVGVAVASRPPDPNHAYGHHRYETLASLAVAGLMLLALFGLVQGAWSRLQTGNVPDVAPLAFIVMGVTLCINAGVTLWERREARKLSSSLLLADARHTTSDILVSLSVIASLVAVRLGFGWADAGIALLIAVAIAWGAWSIVRDASLVLSDATAAAPGEIAQAVTSVPGVRGTHNIRSRGGEGRVWVDLHIQVDPAMRVDDAHDIASEVAHRVEALFGDPTDVTVHVEPANPRHLRDERGYDPHFGGGR